MLSTNPASGTSRMRHPSGLHYYRRGPRCGPGRRPVVTTGATGRLDCDAEASATQQVN